MQCFYYSGNCCLDWVFAPEFSYCMDFHHSVNYICFGYSLAIQFFAIDGDSNSSLVLQILFDLIADTLAMKFMIGAIVARG